MDQALDNQQEAVLSFWFGELDGYTDLDANKQRMWWNGGPDIDDIIRTRFGAAVEAALQGQLDHWRDTARGSLALVILLDQFTRNLGRGTPEAFAGDDRALAACRHACDHGQDGELRLIERAFLYMPMMHAEDRKMAETCKARFAELSKEIAEKAPKGFPDFNKHAIQHADILLRFGRYPHRNEVLERTSTEDEHHFMAAGGPSFGQKKS
jgi:uncharacterized protein (DUF924 family)